MSKVNEQELSELLSAYIDGELNTEEAQRIERILRTDAGARQLLDDLRRTTKLVSLLPRHQAPGSIAEEVRARVERSELLGDADSSPAARSGRWSPLLKLASMAAMLCVLTVGWWVVTVRNGTPQRAGKRELAVGSQPLVEKAAREPAGAGSDIARPSALSAIPAETKGKDKHLAETPGMSAKEAKADSDSERELIAMAGFEQKLRAGMGAGAVLTHAFDNEPVRLQVVVKNAAERDAVATQVAAYLRGHRLTDLADAPADEGEHAVRRRSFYYQGAPVANFSHVDEKQILVCASREDVSVLLDEVGQAITRKDRLTLQAGPLSVRGLERAQIALYGLGEREEPTEPLRLTGAESAHSVKVAEESRGPAGEGAAPGTKGAGAFDKLVEALSGPMKARGPMAVTTREEPVARPATPATCESAGNRSTTVTRSAAPEHVEDAGLNRKPGFVDRRLRQLEGAVRRESTGTSPWLEAGKPDFDRDAEESELPPDSVAAVEPGMEPYVTLVVQFIVEKPKSPATGIRRK